MIERTTNDIQYEQCSLKQTTSIVLFRNQIYWTTLIINDVIRKKWFSLRFGSIFLVRFQLARWNRSSEWRFHKKRIVLSKILFDIFHIFPNSIRRNIHVILVDMKNQLFQPKFCSYFRFSFKQIDITAYLIDDRKSSKQCSGWAHSTFHHSSKMKFDEYISNWYWYCQWNILRNISFDFSSCSKIHFHDSLDNFIEHDLWTVHRKIPFLFCSFLQIQLNCSWIHSQVHIKNESSW